MRTLSLSVAKRWFREPVLHFVLVGAAFFGIYANVQPRVDAGPSSKQIALTVDELRQLNAYFESQWRRPPTPREFKDLIESKVKEEVLYREALAIGLDKDDTIVKRRMAQKMQFLAEDVAAAHEPTTAELKSWFEKNGEKLAVPSRATFRHLYFSFDRRGEHAHDDAAAALAKVADQPEGSKVASALADPFMFQDYYGDRTPTELVKEFGPSFARSLFQSKPRSWQGPIESGFGWHLVWVEGITPSRIPDFEEVESEVKIAWLADQKDQAWSKAYEAMRAKYTLLVPVPSGEEATRAVVSSPATMPPASDEGAS